MLGLFYTFYTKVIMKSIFLCVALDIIIYPFPYYGTVERNGAVVISGVTVNGVYKLAEGSWEPVSGVKFDYVDNTYTFPVRAEGSYINIYMVQSVNSQHYYFGISAGNNK